MGRIKNTVNSIAILIKAMILNLMKKTARLILQNGRFYYGKLVLEPFLHFKNRSKADRMLEIGPGPTRLQGFETASIVCQRNVDYVVDASKKLPFKDDTFSLVYASHILEHIPWYYLDRTMKEWQRIIKPNGILEIFVPDGYKIAKAFINAEDGIINDIGLDGWYKFNPEKDPCIWANGRIFSYGDGFGSKAHPNWHLAIFSERYLHKILANAGFVDIVQLTSTDVRGYDHGWINMGVRARKPEL